MCGRYSLAAPGDVIAEIFALASAPDLRPRWNVAPTQDAPVVRADTEADEKGARRLDLLHWGLVPFWAKEVSIGNRMINARAETAHEKASFKHALRRRRCLVPVDGFYEWQKTAEGKVPTRIRRGDGRPFALAGLWEVWKRGPGEPLESFTILTTTPNALLRPIHDRMPVILDRGDWEQWLDPAEQDVERVRALLAPASPEGFETFAVSRRVNSPAHDDAECAAPV